MKQVLLLFIIAIFIGCVKTSNKSISFEQYQELLQQTILPKPDSILTKEQLLLKIKIFDFLCEHTYVEDNCQKLSVGKDSMERAGIPAIYYDVIMYQFDETNKEVKRMIDSGEIPAIHLQMDSLMKEYKTRYFMIERNELLKRLE